MPLTIILVECGLELIPEEIKKHPAVQKNLRRANISSLLLDNALHHSAMVKLKDFGKRGLNPPKSYSGQGRRTCPQDIL